MLRKSLTRRWWWAMTWITRKDLACEETERSILRACKRPCGTETLMYEDPEQVLGYCSTAQDQGWKGWQSDHAGLGKHMRLHSVNHCIYICKNTFVILIFPVTLLTYFASCHCIDFKTIIKTNTKILSNLVFNNLLHYFPYERDILLTNIPKVAICTSCKIIFF